MARVGDYPWVVAFQSRSGPVKWMEPGTEEMVIKLGKEGCTSLLMVPISFVSDHIETLEEIDVEYRDLALANGIENFKRAPSLNDHDDFLQGLADLVKDRCN